MAGAPSEEGNWNHFGGLCMTLLYHPALAGTPPEEGNWNHFGGLFQTCLRQAGWNEGMAGIMAGLDTAL